MADHDVLVVGATGTTGGAVVAELAANGIHPRALVREPERAAGALPDGVETVRGDLDDPASLTGALGGIRHAYLAMPTHPDTVARAERFIAAAQDAGLDHVVRLSALGAAVDAPAEILRQHGECDRLLMASGLGYTILRPNGFFQNLFAHAPSIREAGRFFLPAGDAAQCLLDARDIAAVAARALSRSAPENQVLELDGPESVTHDQVAERLGRATGRPVAYVPISVEESETALRTIGISEWEAHAVAELLGYLSDERYGRREADVSRLLDRPARTLDAFIDEHRAAFVG